MIIEKDPQLREAQIREVLDQCLVSLPARRSRYNELRRWFLYGNTGSVAAKFNKIYPTVDQLTAFTFSAESTRFALELDEHEDTEISGDETERADILSKAIRDVFCASRGDDTVTVGLMWAFCFGNMLVKPLWVDGRIRYYLVEPGNFGVLREDCPYLDEQEAMAETYVIDKAQLRRLLMSSGRPAALVDEYMAQVKVLGGDKVTPEETNFVGRLVISQSTPTMVGNIADLQNWSSSMVPEIRADLVEMHELRVWDDELDDYRIFTMCGNDTIIFDRALSSMTPKGEPGYIDICPNPVYNYFWGKSDVEAMIPLQIWREDRMRQIDSLWQRQLKPPRFASGIMGLTDEKIAALYRVGGVVGEQNPAAKIETLNPSMPPDPFAEIREIDMMFEYTVGLPPITQGRGEPGVRAGDQADSLSRMPAARMRKRSLQVERALSCIGEFSFKILQREDAKVYHTEEGQAFAAGQFPDQFRVNVAAHSSSPLFSEDMKRDTELMLKEGLIDGETAIELMDPPMAQVLMARYRKREKAKEADQKQEHDMLAQALTQLAPPEKANILSRLLTGLRGSRKP